MYASRNLNICTKDCICLFVCPTGATDTETGQIDKDRCIDGCRLCVDACPSKAIFLVPESYPERKAKDAGVVSALTQLLQSKAVQETAADRLQEQELADAPGAERIARALAYSNRLLAEDCAREAGFMTPDDPAVKDVLRSLAEGESASLEGSGNDQPAGGTAVPDEAETIRSLAANIFSKLA